MSSGNKRDTGESEFEIPPEYQQEELIEEPPSTKKKVFRVLRTDLRAKISIIVIILFLSISIFAPFIAPQDRGQTFTPLQEPNSHSEGDFDGDGETERTWHPLGTDSLGHDMLTRLIYGSRISLFVAGITVLFAFIVGTTIGLVAGYYKGWVDDLLMRYIDFQWAFPSLILAIGIIAISGSLGVINVVIAIGVAYIDDFARIVRGEVLSIREQPYIMAAKAVGMRNRRILGREILPNAVGPIMVQITLMIPLAILAEAGLSFLGLGVRPETPTWGLMISDGRDWISSAWWISILPGLCIMAVVLAFNMLGDGLQEVFDISEDTEEEATR